MDSPVAATTAPGDGHHLFVADQDGKLWSITVHGHGDRHERWLVADLSGLLVGDLAQIITGLPYDERGLLGVAFDPDFRHDGPLYTFTSEDPTAPADFTTRPRDNPGGERASPSGWSPTRGPTTSPSTGPGDVPGGNGQGLAEGNVLGKVLRIDPHGDNSANGAYGVPADNPFVRCAGADEIFAYGFRNRYRVSFDRDHGRLIVADVGQRDIEEVDFVTAGGNFGRPVKEGTFLFDNGGPAGDGSVTVRQDPPGVQSLPDPGNCRLRIRPGSPPRPLRAGKQHRRPQR